MRCHILTIIAGLLCTAAYAQTDTIPVHSYRTLSQPLLDGPVLNDSINLYGKKYDPFMLLAKFPTLQVDQPLLETKTASMDGDIALGANAIHTIQLSLVTTRYEEVSLIVECTAPYLITLDGLEVGRCTDSTPGPQSHTLSLTPSVGHNLALRIITNSPQSLRLSLAPKVGANSTLRLRTDSEAYMSMEFTQTGRKINSVDISPSGKYMVVWMSDVIKDRYSYSGIMYKGEKPIAVLPDELRFAKWMPSEDRLLQARETNTGRALVTIDPEHLSSDTLIESIPDGSFVMAPNSKTIIFTQLTKGPQRDNTVERVLNRDDHQGSDSSRDRSFLYSFDLHTGAFYPITYGYRSTYLQAIAPDSKEIIYSSPSRVDDSPFAITDYIATDLQTMQADTLFSQDSHISGILYTSRPEMLLVLGDADAFGGIGRNLPDGKIANGFDTQLFLYNRKTRHTQPLTKDFAPNIVDIRTSPDTYQAILKAEDEDYIRLYLLDLSCGKIKLLPTAEENIRSFTTSRDLHHIAYSGESANNSERLYLDNRCLYDLAGDRLKNIRLGEVHAWKYTKSGGETVPGRFYLPPTFSADKKYPLIVYYYGGTSPSSRMFSWYYSAPMYAAQDYVVLVLNPSGTTGWGQEYASRHVNAWGDPTADDIISAVKGFCQEKNFVDTTKIGCFGASYGGFMTQYLLTQTDLFAAAMSHAGISNITSYWGQGTWGVGYSTVASAHSYPWNNPKLYTEQSPLFSADKINTPLLLLHGDSDTNVPYGESVQMYNALKILNKEVELVRVYGQDHHVTDLQQQRKWMQTTMAWFQKWLKGDPSWWDHLYPEIHL